MANHPHAALMLQYAQDAMSTEDPWTLWQYFKQSEDSWRDCSKNPGWLAYNSYRRKPQTIKIGEFEVPEPLRIPPPQGETYCFVAITGGDGSYCESEWTGDKLDMKRLASGIIHFTAEAALLHSHALLSLSKAK